MCKIKYSILFFLGLLLLSCDSESAWNCVKKPGAEVEFEELVDGFHSVVIQGHLDLVVIQDSLPQIKVHTRKNLVDNIKFSVEDKVLYIEEKSSCNILRDRSYTTIYLSAPELYNIRNASTGSVRNEGIWKQNKIALISENHLESSYYNNGLFDMHLEVDELSVLANGNSLFQLLGSAKTADVSFYSGNARLEAETMRVLDLEVFHRGANHMMVYPIQSIRGEIVSTGDVRSYNKPPIVEVDEKYSGSLIFVE